MSTVLLSDGPARGRSGLTQGERCLISSVESAGERAARESEAKAARLLADMVEASKSRYIGAEGIAAVYVRLGDANSAFRWLDSAVVARSAYVLSLKADRKWDPIRADPRFAALVQRIGLP